LWPQSHIMLTSSDFAEIFADPSGIHWSPIIPFSLH